MKNIIFPGLASLVLLASCSKNRLNDDANAFRYDDPSNAQLKFVNSFTALTPSLGSPANGPTVDFYVNNVKINATALAYLGYYPNTTGGGMFASVPSGSVNIKAVLNRTTAGTGLPSDTIANYNFSLAPGKAHTVMLVDPLPNPTPYNPNMMVVQESVSMPAYGKYKLRLMNLVATNELYELYHVGLGTVITAPVPFKNFSDWIELPSTTGSTTFQIRLAGTTTVIATSASFTPGNQRSYTFWARGNPAVTGRTRSIGFYTTQ